MKIFNEKVIKFFSKFVNLQRVEIFTWCDPAEFEKNINNSCGLSESKVLNYKNGDGVVKFKNCCRNRKNFNIDGMEVLRCG